MTSVSKTPPPPQASKDDMVKRNRWSMAELQLLLRVWKRVLEEEFTVDGMPGGVAPAVSARIVELYREQDHPGLKPARTNSAIGHVKNTVLSLAEFITSYRSAVATASKAVHSSLPPPA